jgi:hypothetical protein
LRRRKYRGRIESTMAKAKKKTPEEVLAAYAAEVVKSYEITPRMRAEGHAKMKADAERARAAGVYDALREIHERRVRERAEKERKRK